MKTITLAMSLAIACACNSSYAEDITLICGNDVIIKIDTDSKSLWYGEDHYQTSNKYVNNEVEEFSADRIVFSKSRGPKSNSTYIAKYTINRLSGTLTTEYPNVGNGPSFTFDCQKAGKPKF